MSATLFLLPALSASREDCFSLGGFGRFPLDLFGEPPCLRLFPGLAFGFTSCGFGGLPVGQFGRFLFLRRASGCLSFSDATTAGGDDLVTGL